MGDLPLLLESSNELALFGFIHKELLTVHVSFLFDLHLSNELVFVLNFLLDVLEVLWNLTIVLFLEEISLSVGWQSWGSKDVLNSIGHNKVLIRDEAHDWLLFLGWNWDLLGTRA